MKRTTVIKSAAVLGVASLALAACGGSSTSSESSASAAPAESSAAASAAASAEATAAASAECKNPALVTGTLLPQTGDLAFLGPPEFAGVKKAVDEINAAGGVNGSRRQLRRRLGRHHHRHRVADGRLAPLAGRRRHHRRGLVRRVADRHRQDHRRRRPAVLAGEHLARARRRYDDAGLYLRAAPSDALQGAVIAGNAIEAGLTKMAVIARQDPYGEGLQDAFAKNFTDAGGTVAPDKILYDPAAASFEAEVGQIKAAAPEGVVVIGFEETTKIMQELIKQGVGPQDVQIYLVDGNLSTAAYKDFPKGTMKGVHGTIPVGEADLTDFNASLKEIDPSLEDYTYGARGLRRDDPDRARGPRRSRGDGTAIAQHLVAGGQHGWREVHHLRRLHGAAGCGHEIDFEGVSGPCDFNENGDPKTATIGVYQYSADNKFAEVTRVTGGRAAAVRHSRATTVAPSPWGRGHGRERDALSRGEPRRAGGCFGRGDEEVRPWPGCRGTAR